MQGNDGDSVSIVASFYPVYIFTLNLIDSIEGVSLENMTDMSGGCLHDYQLTSKDMKLLNGADLLVVNGAGMEGFIEKALEGAKNLKIADSSEGIELIIDGERSDGPFEDSDLHEANPHIWMSVPNAVRQVENIYAALVELLPEKTDKLRENKDRYIASLNDLNEEIKEASSKVTLPAICFHDAFEYFMMEYSMPVIAYVEVGEGSGLSAKELGELKELITLNGVRALFVGPDYSGSAATVLANETGAEKFILNPVISGEKTKTAYEDIMRQNILTLAEAM